MLNKKEEAKMQTLTRSTNQRDISSILNKDEKVLMKEFKQAEKEKEQNRMRLRVVRKQKLFLERPVFINEDVVRKDENDNASQRDVKPSHIVKDDYDEDFELIWKRIHNNA